MPKFRVDYSTRIHISVDVEAEDETYADDVAHTVVEDYLGTLGVATGDDRIRFVEASVDGIGADSVEEQS